MTIGPSIYDEDDYEYVGGANPWRLKRKSLDLSPGTNPWRQKDAPKAKSWLSGWPFNNQRTSSSDSNWGGSPWGSHDPGSVQGGMNYAINSDAIDSPTQYIDTSRRGATGPDTGWPELDPYNSNWEDLLAQAMGIFGSGTSTSAATQSVDNRIAAAKAATGEANSRIDALYDALNKTLLSSQPKLTHQMQSGLNAGREQTKQSQAALNDAIAAAQASGAENLEEIGIGDSELLKADRGRTASDHAFASGQLQNTAANQADYRTQTLNKNQGIQRDQVSGAAFAGTGAQVDNERALVNILAGLEDERMSVTQAAQESQRQAKLQAYQMALDMENQNYSRWANNRDFEFGADNAMYDRATGEDQTLWERSQEMQPDPAATGWDQTELNHIQMVLAIEDLPPEIRQEYIARLVELDPAAYAAYQKG